ncbi:MAG TPA: 1-deoxy-D-xylulose-5-phosphate reductoisomerase [Bacillota bacterium]|jgi:1-deoxy-D-xylulose-5-phosphate reductoisomerase|nr:1-deoxy-D-xylulose-5-phosphate reductoisomerase [Clostridiales bacterium UBA9856]HOA42721.1 1-deoxy-D-xylulose-5-phosphate reductoisomerase [Bacillota bacterium]HPZ59662.1 1-deoxy-D-xylulose-5-phosphate reductoisomerase [Bacillota bacterium]HQC83050.1 1-deoxy-D-xylulose-5-phosphate reductoisomerase [Bacillota bacterium]
MKKIAILGSTGSIGTQALDIVKRNRDRFRISALTCGRQTELLVQQIREFQPEIVCVEREEDAIELKEEFPKTDIFWGKQGLKQTAALADCDMVLNALVGMRGLEPTLSAIRAGRDIALANKETLVAGGEIVMKAASENEIRIIPVDSEHSAIFQALQGNQGQEIRRIILTASGGPFRGYTLSQLSRGTLEQALKHPNWNMGNKITIDSATMMNKGLEVIEARWLFDADPEIIQVVVHRESIIHSMVEFVDHSIIAQLGMPDMRVPIGYAFSYPERLENDCQEVDFLRIGQLHFEPVNMQVFRCLGLAYEALKKGGSYPVVLNAANEVMVQKFLEKKIAFIDIQNTVEKVLEEHVPLYDLSLEDILGIDKEIRERLSTWE